MDGFLLLFKEKGISSNQLVQKVKKLLSLKKVGHIGTLDPMEEGLLVLALNRATRFSSFFLNSDKVYQANVKLGSKTDTDDALGKIIDTSDQIPTESEIDSALKSFIGISKQEAPFFSALKHKGQPLYKYARQGEFISKPPRKITISNINNFSYKNKICSFQLEWSKGTYIRSIARDLGQFNIRVNCVVPGWIITERQKKLWLTPEAEKEQLERQCIKRMLVPEDIAKAVLFFSSDQSSGCTAQNYVIDGGVVN